MVMVIFLITEAVFNKKQKFQIASLSLILEILIFVEFILY